MKLKLTLVAALLVTSSIASALEVGINAGRTFASDDRNSTGITLGQKTGAVGIEAGFDAFRSGVDQNRWSLIGSYDVTQVAGVTVAVKAGGAWLDNKGTTSDGYTALVGAGASYPLNKQLALTADYKYQVGQKRVDQFNGGNVTAGLKYSF
jgi:hypothetical protein